MNRQPRGQGTVELVLGLLVFVTVLIFGIHFAEIGYLTLKVHESATSALWDTTSAKMHTLPGKFNALEQLISSNKPGQLATDRYKDFDGRTSKQGGKAPEQVFTSADGLTVTCERAQDIVFKPQSPSKNAIYTRVYKQDVGGMTCNATAELSPSKRLIRTFLDQGPGAFFSVPHYAVGAIPVCAMGRSRNGQCAGGFGILLDDWGLAGREESRNCVLLQNCANKAYFDSTKIVYDDHNTVNGASSNLARTIVGVAPIDPGKFFMSFRGMDDSFTDKVNKGDKDQGSWVTTPGAKSRTTEYDKSYNGRKDCFLGAECP
ncbi:hypothetical protein [Melittangium boletus]|uniref:Pilus assembly protein n=1 Tax=Melittangium boletus DSM 14713 TaxID=1294270 RepID=A0A250IJN2_9BACT|nr:hypothetical protein [Melittangium boletus]ATB31965.1 hypothetical protein MEBOL_005437 [Melittangium boletus DSM 14713]